MKERNLKFSRQIKEEVRNGHCACCGQEVRHAQIHHIIPRWFVKQLRRDKLTDPEVIEQFKAFVKSKDNAIPLDSRCHKHFDRLAQEQMVFYGFDKPLGIPMRRDVEYKMD